MRSLEAQAREIFAATLRKLDIRRIVGEQIRLNSESLLLGGIAVPLRELDRILIVAVGKAALPMVRGVKDSLQRERTSSIRSITVTNQTEFVTEDDLLLLPGAHPLPDERSVQAAEAILSALSAVDERTAVLFLISGGASAMIEAPLDPRIPLADVAAFYQALIGSGLPIAAMNALRKHCSAVKGGRLAQVAAAARVQYTLLVSDVPAHLPDAIGSGPSLPDASTLADCSDLLPGLMPLLPQSVVDFFNGPLCVETPKPEDPAFRRAHWVVISSSEHLAQAAAAQARQAGFHAEIDNRCDEWEYRDASRYLIDRGLELTSAHRRCCLISVGEVGVTLPAQVGEGGRNQQFALWCAAELARRGVRATVLSAGSDGIDGNSDAAGAVCDESTLTQACALGFDAERAMRRFDTTPLLRAMGATIETGPTGMNLRDLRLLLFDR
jgi:hydroxypyruvate reductase